MMFLIWCLFISYNWFAWTIPYCQTIPPRKQTCVRIGSFKTSRVWRRPSKFCTILYYHSILNFLALYVKHVFRWKKDGLGDRLTIGAQQSVRSHLGRVAQARPHHSELTYLSEHAQKCHIDAYGHTTGNTPEPVRFQKLSLVRPS